MALWFLTVVQEPSLGMYYVQNHFKESLERTLDFKVITIDRNFSSKKIQQNELTEVDKKLSGATLDIQRTKKEVDEIAQLNGVWSNSMSDLLDQLEKSYQK